MIMSSVPRNRSLGSVAQHGCNIAMVGTFSKAFRRCFATFFSMVCLLCWVDVARAELKLYVNDDSGNFLEVFDNQAGDLNSDLGIIEVNPDSLSQKFGTSWIFGVFFAEDSIAVNNTDQAVRRLNLQFDATNNEIGTTKSIEVKVLSTGFAPSLPNELSLYGNGTTNQKLPIISPLDVRIAGAFNTDESGGYQTNDYDDLTTGPPLWVLGAQGGDIEFAGYDNNGGNSFLVQEPYTTPFTPDGLYSMTVSTYVAGLKYEEKFGVQADLEFVVPEPASLVTWGLFATFLGGAAKRRRMAKVPSDLSQNTNRN